MSDDHKERRGRPILIFFVICMAAVMTFLYSWMHFIDETRARTGAQITAPEQ